MSKLNKNVLDSEAPAWLQGALTGFLASASLAGIASLFLFSAALFLSTLFSQVLLAPAIFWVLPLLIFTVSLVWLVPRQTRLIGVLNHYAEALANERGTTVERVREQMWQTHGPAFETLGLFRLLAIELLIIPGAMLLFTGMLSSFIGDSLPFGDNVTGLTLIALALSVPALLLFWHTRKKSAVATLLSQAARQEPTIAEDTIRQAVMASPTVHERSALFWIALTLLNTWIAVSVFSQVLNEDWPSGVNIALWIGLSVPGAILAIRYARHQGAPAKIWLGVAAYPILGTMMLAIVYFGLLQPLLVLLEAGNSSQDLPHTTPEILTLLARNLLIDMPMVVAAWIAARRPVESELKSADA